MSYIERALKVAAEHAGSRVEELMSDIRFPQYVRARWAVMLGLKHRRASLTHAAIGRLVHRDASTVHHGIEKGSALKLRDPEFAALCERVAAA